MYTHVRAYQNVPEKDYSLNNLRYKSYKCMEELLIELLTLSELVYVSGKLV